MISTSTARVYMIGQSNIHKQLDITDTVGYTSPSLIDFLERHRSCRNEGRAVCNIFRKQLTSIRVQRFNSNTASAFETSKRNNYRLYKLAIRI